jgi:hypothetical protein
MEPPSLSEFSHDPAATFLEIVGGVSALLQGQQAGWKKAPGFIPQFGGMTAFSYFYLFCMIHLKIGKKLILSCTIYNIARGGLDRRRLNRSRSCRRRYDAESSCRGASSGVILPKPIRPNSEFPDFSQSCGQLFAGRQRHIMVWTGKAGRNR